MPEYRKVTICSECKYFRAYSDGTYGNCTRTTNQGAVYRKNDFCSYAEPKYPPLPEYDDHDVSGLLDD